MNRIVAMAAMVLLALSFQAVAWDSEEQNTVARAIQTEPGTFALFLNRVLDDVDDAALKADILARCQKIVTAQAGAMNNPLVADETTKAEMKALEADLRKKPKIDLTLDKPVIFDNETIAVTVAVTPRLMLDGTAAIQFECSEGNYEDMVVDGLTATATWVPAKVQDLTWVVLTVTYGSDLSESAGVTVLKYQVEP